MELEKIRQMEMTSYEGAETKTTVTEIRYAVKDGETVLGECNISAGGMSMNLYGVNKTVQEIDEMVKSMLSNV